MVIELFSTDEPTTKDFVEALEIAIKNNVQFFYDPIERSIEISMYSSESVINTANEIIAKGKFTK